MPRVSQSNFSQLKAHDEQLERLGMLAERYFAGAPNTCLLKLRQLAEKMAQSEVSQVGLYASAEEKQIDLLRRLQDHSIVPREAGVLFSETRKANENSNNDLAEYQWLIRPSVLGVGQRLAIGIPGRELVPQDTNNDPAENAFTLLAARTHYTRRSVGKKTNTV